MLQLTSLLIAFNLFLHPLHMSVTNIEYQQEKQAFNLSFKIFRDDLEGALFHNYQKVMHFGQENEYAQADSLLNQYLSTHFALTFNQQQYTPGMMEFQGREVKSDPSGEEVLWVYYKLPLAQPLKQATVKNSILHDMFYNQKNLVFFNYKSTEKAYKLDMRERTHEIEL